MMKTDYYITRYFDYYLFQTLLNQGLQNWGYCMFWTSWIPFSYETEILI